MKNKSLFYIFLFTGAVTILPHRFWAQVPSPLLKAITHNGYLTLQANNQTTADSLFVRDTSNQVSLDFYFTQNDVRNGFHAAQPSPQLQGDVYMTFQDIPWQSGDALSFSVAQYGPTGDIVRAYTFVNGDYTGPNGVPPPACPTSISCNSSGLTLGFNPQQYSVIKMRSMPLSLSFGAGHPSNGIYYTSGADVETNVAYVKGNFDCNRVSAGPVQIVFDGLVCQFEGGHSVDLSGCSPFGDYYTPGDVCGEYFENCAGKLISMLFDSSSSLPCRPWKEVQASTCGTDTYIYRAGKVSIGTSRQAPRSSSVNIPNNSPKAALTVKNGVITDKVKVKLCDAAWCDYVFGAGYPLRSLPSTEAYIQENCHLPGIPSGGAIEAAGAFELGEITRLQQEKIEEIYLHLIALQEEVERLEIELAIMQWRERAATR